MFSKILRKTKIEDFQKAIEERNEEQAILLLEDSNFDPSFDNDWALSRSGSYNLYKLIPFLLKDHRVKLNNSFILSNAVLKNNIEAVELFLNDGRIDPSQEGNWAIQIASQNGFTKIVKILLADRRTDPTVDNFYCLRKSVSLGSYDIVKLLLEDKRIIPNVYFNEFIIEAFNKKYIKIVKLLWCIKEIKQYLKNNEPENYAKIAKEITKDNITEF